MAVTRLLLLLPGHSSEDDDEEEEEEEEEEGSVDAMASVLLVPVRCMRLNIYVRIVIVFFFFLTSCV
jgi:hypothetical protein